jgi:hypothetical protein
MLTSSGLRWHRHARPLLRRTGRLAVPFSCRGKARETSAARLRRNRRPVSELLAKLACWLPAAQTGGLVKLSPEVASQSKPEAADDSAAADLIQQKLL